MEEGMVKSAECTLQMAREQGIGSKHLDRRGQGSQEIRERKKLGWRVPEVEKECWLGQKTSSQR
jgi:hypothetical protein